MTQNKGLKLFSSESVAPGHPDKICDQIADSILDAILTFDQNAKVACEVFITTNYLLIGGEVHSKKLAQIDIKSLAKAQAIKILSALDYDCDENGFNVYKANIKVLIHEQSPDILQGVELRNHQIGAGDQGIMFGFACKQTKNLMPLAIEIAHEFVKKATELKNNGQFKDAKSDMKVQVTIDETIPEDLKINLVLMSIQHDANYDPVAFQEFIHKNIMIAVASKYKLNTDFEFLINPTGKFTVGGPQGDTGLTGRKTIVDTYGGAARSGGGAFSGKDATKVDRTAAYYARYIAKNIVAAGLASKCEIQLAYAIGVSSPVSINVETFNTINNKLTESKLLEIINKHFDCTLENMINELELRHQKYLPLATYGHFGREDLNIKWEKTDKIVLLQQYLERDLKC